MKSILAYYQVADLVVFRDTGSHVSASGSKVDYTRKEDMYETERERRNGVVKSYRQRQDGIKTTSGIVKYLALYNSIYV